MRSVAESPEAQTAADDAFEAWSRAEEAWEAIKWALARDPTVGEPLVEGGNLRVLTFEGALAYDMPTIVVLYDYDMQRVVIKSARFEVPKAGQIGRA
jgi:hypothetical protein